MSQNEPEAIYKYCREKIFSLLPEGFWIRNWALPLHDSQVMRSKIKDDLKTISHNARRSQRDWYDELSLISLDTND